MKFRASLDGTVTGLRFYKGSGNNGGHVGHLWSRTGEILATASFAAETAAGWQQVSFSAPVPVAAGTTYVASYFAPYGHYSVDYNYFAAGGTSSGPVTALAAGLDGANGVYRYLGSGFPTSTYQSSNYWVDVIFVAATATPTPDPTSVPVEPTGLSVTGVSSNSVSLAWADVADETGYRVERSEGSTSTWTVVGSTVQDSTTLIDTSALPSTTYSYRVLAFNAAGTSVASSATTAVTPPSPTSSTCSGVVVTPASDIPSLMRSRGPGTVYCFQAGMYRLLAAIAPKTGDVLSGQPGTILSGARVVSTWSASGSMWVATGQLPPAYSDTGYNPCQDTTTNLCKLNEWLFQDDVQLRRVASAAAVVAGTYFTDYAANRVYVGSNPAGHRLELSRTKTAITSAASGVVLSGLVVEKFATANQRGAIVANGAGWTIQSCEVRFNHGAGIYGYANNLKVLNSRVHHNGTLGIAVHNATGIVIDGNELDYNNTDGSWINDGENGGYKSTKTTDIVRNNNVHHNMGLGLWFDIDDKGSMIEGNTIADNASDGIRYEISYDGVIRNNTVVRNGLNRQHGNGNLYYGASINVANSTNVQVYGNTVTGGDNGIGLAMQSRGSGMYGLWTLANVYVHDNTVGMARGQTGLVQSVGDASFFTTKNNRFVNNTYNLDSLTAGRFSWKGTSGGFGNWQEQGQDVGGTASVGA